MLLLLLPFGHATLLAAAGCCLLAAAGLFARRALAAWQPACWLAGGLAGWLAGSAAAAAAAAAAAMRRDAARRDATRNHICPRNPRFSFQIQEFIFCPLGVRG